MKSRFTSALSTARTTATARAARLPARTPTPLMRIRTPRSRWVQPQVVVGPYHETARGHVVPGVVDEGHEPLDRLEEAEQDHHDAGEHHPAGPGGRCRGPVVGRGRRSDIATGRTKVGQGGLPGRELTGPACPGRVHRAVPRRAGASLVEGEVSPDGAGRLTLPSPGGEPPPGSPPGEDAAEALSREGRGARHLGGVAVC